MSYIGDHRSGVGLIVAAIIMYPGVQFQISFCTALFHQLFLISKLIDQPELSADSSSIHFF